MNNNPNEMEILKEGDTITFKIEERHRLVGLSNFGVVAEIWIHTDLNNPSDEQDIVRLQDDYSRN
jgi:quercetin dioxygenase-like cupin family protein